MSKEIVDILIDYSNEKQQPLMIIASRNQVDAYNGYVITTEELANSVKSKPRDNILLCRDHCGPYYFDDEKNLDLHSAVAAAKKTIFHDISNGFDLIHIDTSRAGDKSYEVADELINFALEFNPNISFEFGSEENVGVAASVQKYKQDVAFAKNYPNIKFVVAQTGSLCFEDKQTGTFDEEVVKELVTIANDAGVKLKEHNADYLNAQQIQQRKMVGVHAMNIAPQLGVTQTKLLRRLAKNRELGLEWEIFAQEVLAHEKWKKWTTSTDDRQKVAVAGHYHFASVIYNEIKENLNSRIDFEKYLKREIYSILDLYYNNFQ